MTTDLHPIVCAGPGPHNPPDGIVGYLSGAGAPPDAPPAVDGTVCASPDCQPAPIPEPVDVAAQLAELLDAIASATSLTDLQARIAQEGTL